MNIVKMVRLIAAGAVVTGAIAQKASADTHVWKGGTGNWGTSGNWTNGQVPAAGDVVRYDGNSTAGGTVSTLAAAADLDSILMTSGVNVDLTVTGENQDLGFRTGINMSGADKNLYINLGTSTKFRAVRLRGNNIWSIASGRQLRIGANCYISDLTSSYSLEVTGGGQLRIDGNASNNTTIDGGLTVTGGSTLLFNGNRALPGSTTIREGVLRASANWSQSVAVDIAASAGASATFDLNTFSGTLGDVTLTDGTIQNGTLTGSSFEVKNGTISANLAGAAAVLTKSTAGTVTLSGANTYGGGTLITEGTLVVNNATGSGTGSGAVTISGGATLSGPGSVNAVGGAGLISPGNSPGILTASSIDPADGIDFAFEFTMTAPDYLHATASNNDVLRLTGDTPFSSSLDVENAVGIYLDAGALANSQVFKGGFFADQDGAVALLGAIQGAAYSFYVADAAGTVAFNGVNYLTLADYNTAKGTSWAVQVGTAEETADFGSGSIIGSVTTLTVVPEPATAGILLMGLVGVALRRRALRA